jgi:DNA-binding transcriptional LysR family regulator
LLSNSKYRTYRSNYSYELAEKMFKTLATPLAYFAAVARLGSIRGAAELLRIAPSALSRQIHQMEDLAGMALFERVPRGVNLTPAGEILFSYVQRWEKDFSGLGEDLRIFAGLRAGTLKLATVEIATYSVVPRAIRALRDAMPGITVNTKVDVTDAVLRDIADGKAEVGVVINMPKAAGVRSAWGVRTAVGAVVLPDHPLAQYREVRIADCLAYPIIMPDETLMVRSAIRRALERTRRGVLVAGTCNRIASIKGLAKAGVGVAFLVELDVATELERGEFCFVKLKDRDIEAPYLSVVIPKHDKPSPAALKFLDLLKRELSLGKDTNTQGQPLSKRA